MDSLHTTALFGSERKRLFSLIESQFRLSPERLASLTQAFLDEMQAGLKEYKRPMAMIPTFVTGVPDGTETGTFLALDLGGTNLRVCAVQLNGDKTLSLRQQKYKVSETLKTGEASALFDYLADSVDAFLTSPAHVDDFESQTVYLGMTFSFPVEQTALDSGKLLTWTKGFSAKHAVGKDVVKLLQDAFDRKHMHVKCVALINDTVGTLLSRAYATGSCKLGVIFGTGTNGAYVERVPNIRKLAHSHPKISKAGGDMVVNCEWGAFDNTRSHLPSTPYDRTLDRLSVNPSAQALEKFISGMYLGEITRLVLLSLVDATFALPPGKPPLALLFGGKGSEVMNKMWALDSSVMSEIEDAWQAGQTEPPTSDDETLSVEDLPFEEGQLSGARRKQLERVRDVVVRRFGYGPNEVGLWDAAVVRWVSALVARRAALLSGVPIAAILIHAGEAVLGGQNIPSPAKNKIVVGVDGSLIEHYPNFERMLRKSLRSVVGAEAEARVEIGLAKDGSGVGAALGALQALKGASLN